MTVTQSRLIEDLLALGSLEPCAGPETLAQPHQTLKIAVSALRSALATILTLFDCTAVETTILRRLQQQRRLAFHDRRERTSRYWR